MAHCKKIPISFLITTNCNMQCKYCYTKLLRKRNETISLEFAKLGIDTFLTNKTAHIRFYGAGEPTTEFNLLKEIYNYAFTKVNGHLITEIQTNGIFDKNVAQWIAEHVDIVWLSWDGLKNTQDYYRPLLNGCGSFSAIEENAKYLLKFGKSMVGVRLTVGKLNVRQQVEIIEYFYKIGIRHIWSDPIFKPVNIDSVPSLETDLMIYAEEFLKAKYRADELGLFYGSILTCNFDEETDINCRACLPSPHLTTDGFVSACDMAMFGHNAGVMSDFIYGEWDINNNKIVLDESKIKNLQNRNISNLIGCKGCKVLKHCAGYCLGEVLNETEDLFGRKKVVCQPIQYLFEKLKDSDCSYIYPHP